MKRKMIIGMMALLGATGAVNAQGFASSKIGVKGGWNMANITNSREGNIDDSKSLNTFNAGVVVALPLGSTFELRTGLDLQSKGAKTTWVEGTNETSYTTNPMYLELPVNIGFMLPFNERTKAYIGAGPYAAMGIAGKNTITVAGNERKENIKWGNDNPVDNENLRGTIGSGQYKKFDFGANIIAGVDFGRVGVHAQYGLGLTNTVPGNSNSDNANKNNQTRTLGVSGVLYF